MRKFSYNAITRGAIIIASFSILSKVLGLLRDRLLASRFGASEITDVYFASFRLPDFIFNLLVLGALSAAFIPVFLEYYHKNGKRVAREVTADIGIETSEQSLASTNVGFSGGLSGLFGLRDRLRSPKGAHEDHWLIANTVLNLFVVLLIGLAVVLYFLVPYIIPVITPGFDVARQGMTIQFTRIMLLSTILLGASNIMGAILQSFERFVFFAMAPIFYNVGIIVGILFLVPLYGPTGLAWGVVLGALFHLLIQMPAVWRVGFHYHPFLALKHPGVRSIIRLIIPRSIGLGFAQINQLINTFIASSLVVGSVAVLTFADNLQSVPVSIFGVSFAVAAFPLMTASIVKNKKKEFAQMFSETFRKILFIVIPASLFMILLRAQIVRVLLGTGAFDWQDTVMTLQVFAAFAVSLFAQSTVPLLARAFYAHKDTKTPVIVGIISVVINIVGSFVLSRVYGVVGIALAFSAAGIFNMAALWILLHHKVGDLDDEQVMMGVTRISAIAFLSGWPVYGMLYLVDLFLAIDTFWTVLLQGLLAGVTGIIVYILLSRVFCARELALVWRGKK